MTHVSPTADSVSTELTGLDRIHDDQLRAAVVRTWVAALAVGGLTAIRDAPQSTGIPGRSLGEHVNDVTRLALSILELADTEYGIPANADTVVAAAILHDVDKAFIQGWVGDGKAAYLPPYGIDDHGAAGAQLALEHGVPEEVAALVRDHAPFNYAGHLPGTIEGTIVHYADLLAADLAAIQHGATPIHARSLIIKRDHPLLAGATLESH
jgi:putative nucleotidyltransferase with HDIG domain